MHEDFREYGASFIRRWIWTYCTAASIDTTILVCGSESPEVKNILDDDAHKLVE